MYEMYFINVMKMVYGNNLISNRILLHFSTRPSTCSPVSVTTPLTLQLCLQQDPLQLPLQEGGSTVLWSYQTVPLCCCHQALQLHP